MKNFYFENIANGYEKENNRLSYAHAVEFLIGNVILCNNIADADQSIWDNVKTGYYYDDENDEYIDIYQYYLCNLSQYQIDSINEFNEKHNENIIVSYSDLLDMDVLMVDHYGTSWDYVLTNCPLNEED